MVRYSIIAAAAENLAIGRDNGIPWHISEDLKNFKKLTTGNIIIMGRKTWDSIGKALPGRTTIVVTASKESADRIAAAGGLVRPSLEKALEAAEEMADRKDADTEIFVAGGASIYEQAIGGAYRMYLSKVPGSFEADTFFPAFDEELWPVKETVEFKDFRLEVRDRLRD